ncbi:DNA alkylation repair protein [Methyloglobulus sp.]|uniref:DNA alkylation repair protein n=1 Tax=Methyloglobulus sp. TaxID=2518622 RepID=UPI0032B82224
MNLQQVITRLQALADPEKIVIKERKFGIKAQNSLGVYHKDLKDLTMEIGRDNNLAHALFETGIYEARILCSKIYDPMCITEGQMDQWVMTFENWEICDSFCMGFFTKSKHGLAKAFEWSENEHEFIKRAGFVIMAAYGFADKTSGNEVFEQFLPVIEREANDDRIYVKKAINWALRNVGKRNIDLNKKAILTAKRILVTDSKPAKWIATNAIAELEKPDVHILDYPRHIYSPKACKSMIHSPRRRG